VLAVLLLAGLPATAVGGRARETTPSFNGSVYAIAQRGDVTYVGGEFTTATSAGHSYPRLRLAAFDSRSGTLLPWAPPADGTVRALAAAGDSVYAAGDFHRVGGLDRDSLARLHADTGAVRSFRHDLTGTAYALASGNGLLYLGGSFSRVDEHRRANLAAFSLTTGKLDGRWRPDADDAVHALAVRGPKVFLGGGFHTVAEVTGTLRLAAVHGTTGLVDGDFRPRAPAEVRAIAVDADGVYAATGGVGGRAIVTAGGVTYVGGHFDSACLTSKNGAHGACADGSEPRFKLAAVTRTGKLASWAPQANGVIGVRVLALSRGTLQAGGDFTLIAGQERRRFAVF
jgi:hypothetical protein